MENLSTLKSLLATPKNIVITAHRNPDGDAIGSSLGLYHFLRKNGHHVQIAVPSDFPDNLSWMPAVHDILVFDDDPESMSDLFDTQDIVFCLDFNAIDRIDKLGALFIEKDEIVKVMIDHHLYPESFPDFMLSDTTASSTCELIFRFIDMLGQKDQIDVEIGECLLTGILTDTGSFKYSTSPALFKIVAYLLEVGVDDYKLQDLIFNSMKEKHLRLLGHCLNRRMEILEEFNTGIIVLTKDDYLSFDIQRGDTEGIVNFLLKIKQIKMAAFIMEQPKIVKISLRSKGDFSVQEIAQKYFRGGGHKNASGGASFIGLRPTVRKFKEILPEYKEKLNS
ncbi:MAG: bifunctional oligoribonuclease/PAP phosphatase NrnA [Saprospiraceae bacterium]